MPFKMKYEIQKDYLTKGSRKRPGNNINVRFIVAHDVGNPGSTAKGNVGYFKRTENQQPASAHLFVDDKNIIECIPALTGTPERAYHVIYNVTTDNALYGYDANDAAIGVELCWGKGINNDEAYKRYVWVLAYLCYKFNLDPKRDIVGHDTLDPKRKIDPTNALRHMGKTFTQLITDVVAEYKECTGSNSTPAPQKATPKVGKTHKIVAGDTLWSIAQKYGTTVARLKALNPEIDVLALRIGGVLVIDPDAEPEKPKSNPQKSVDPRLAAYLKHPPVRPYPGKPVKRGDRGRDVEAIQRALKISVDGIFGLVTEKAVKDYQKKFPFLKVDGIVGYETWNVMF